MAPVFFHTFILSLSLSDTIASRRHVSGKKSLESKIPGAMSPLVKTETESICSEQQEERIPFQPRWAALGRSLQTLWILTPKSHFGQCSQRQCIKMISRDELFFHWRKNVFKGQHGVYEGKAENKENGVENLRQKKEKHFMSKNYLPLELNKTFEKRT